ncbi:MAG: NAD(P)H-dependent oxidoreductase [Actinomycetota bacterium]
MRVLVIDAFEPDDPDRMMAERAVATLTANGHDVDHLDLAGDGFEPFMSSGERAAYHTDQPLVGDDTRASADLVRAADALLFCYPTTTFTVPARLKGWLERVLVLGVAFVFDDKGRVSPGMTQVRRLGVLTTTPHGRRATRRHGDLGRRTIMWTLRLNCNRLCRRTFVSAARGAGADPAAGRRVERAIGRW